MVLILSEINCTLLKQRLKSGQSYTENQPLGAPEGLISRSQLKNGCWTWNFVHMTTLCTNFKRNRPAFISKSAPVSQAEALKKITIFNDIINSKTVGLACVASVPVRRERNSGRAKELFAFGPRENWGKSKKVEGEGWGRGKKGTLSRKPIDFEKPVRPRGSWLVRCGHLDWQMYQVRLNDVRNNSSVTCSMSWRKACELVFISAKIY